MICKGRVRESWEVKLIQKQVAGRQILVLANGIARNAWQQRSCGTCSLNFTFEPKF